MNSMKTCEQNDENSVHFSSVPIRALNISTRNQLSQYLNGEQLIPSSNGLQRDYRGLGQLMGFSFTVINNIMRSNDPFNSLLEMYQNRSDATFEALLQMIEQIGRFDIIDDLTPFFITDAKYYLKNKKSNQISDQSLRNNFANEKMEKMMEQMITYDAYVCYADNDLDFVKELSQFLESPQIGLRLFIRDRDMLLGSWLYQSFAQLIESQCRRILIILSPEFLDCPECEFQTTFATGLAIDQRNRKLIPIVYKRCDLPPIIKMLTKIDMTRGKNSPEWSWNRLVNSLRNTVINNAIVYQRTDSYLALPELPTVSFDSEQIASIKSINESIITLPSYCPTPTAPPLVGTQSQNNSITSEISEDNDSLESGSLLSKENSSKKNNCKKWMQSIKQKFKVNS